MSQQADPMLLSLLEKIANPLTELDMTVTLKGVFAPSEQWYSTFKVGNNPIRPVPMSSLIASKSLIIDSLQGK